MKKILIFCIFVFGIGFQVTKEGVSLSCLFSVQAQAEGENNWENDRGIGGFWENPDLPDRPELPNEPIEGEKPGFEIDDPDIDLPDFPSYDRDDDRDDGSGWNDEERDDGRDDFDNGNDDRDDDRDRDEGRGDDRDNPDIPEKGEKKRDKLTNALESWSDTDLPESDIDINHCLFRCMEALDRTLDASELVEKWKEFSKENDLKFPNDDGDMVDPGDFTNYGIPTEFIDEFLGVYFDNTPTSNPTDVMDAIDREKPSIATITDGENGDHAVVITAYDDIDKEFWYWDPYDQVYRSKPFSDFDNIRIIDGSK